MNPYAEDNEPKYTENQVRKLLEEQREFLRVVSVMRRVGEVYEKLKIVAITNRGLGIEVIVR